MIAYQFHQRFDDRFVVLRNRSTTTTWGQTLRNTYLWNCRMDLHCLKFCSCAISWAYYLTLDFHGKMLKRLYHRNRWADWHVTKGMWIDRKLDPLCDFKSWPHPWPWLWILKVKFWKSCIQRMGGSIHMEWKGSDSLGCWNHYMWPWAMTLILNFQGQILKKLYPCSGVVDWHRTKGMWVDRES